SDVCSSDLGAPRGNLADTSDDNHVIQVSGDFANFTFGQCGREFDLAGVWQSCDGCWCFESAVRFVSRGRIFGVLANLRCKLRDGDLGRTKTTGQIQLQWSFRCLRAGLDRCQGHQLRRNLFWVPDMDASLFCSWNQDVVATHQGSTGNPANLCLCQGNAFWPTCFSRPLRQDSVQGCLDFAVSAVSAEHAAVRGTWQNDV